MTEKALQTKVLKKLRERGGVWVNNSPGPWGKQGISDITGCLEGRFVAIELKRPGTKNVTDALTEAQFSFLEQVREAGGIAIAAASWEDVEQYLRLSGAIGSSSEAA